MKKATISQAYEVWNDRSNGADEGRSTSKGGRAWLSGEFQLCELEALCMILRHESGKLAEGLPELLRNMEPIPDLASLSKRQQDIVTALYTLDPDFAVTFRWISSEAGIHNDDTSRTITRALARKGVTEHVRGLMTDEGSVCGSGYRLTDMGRQMVRIAEGGDV
ncbi:hypothetical protein AGRO_3682 [Agrobacterium sp. ATCC 31749]|uniref:hypothetical protein n=1 Tax=unclassified Agrobacterium TaxID=2632611 RepID=UPI00020DB747|nr:MULTISPECIES: hypothetical protein [unclassified Agrobacterium]EGL63613.1 hypothetical protein AGRO_3682 [Agrobacterium sp. ATCC 31749]QKW97077.1 hypothetical protein GSF67_08245 [Agrobacterium sp. CGMCC 11546]